MTQGLSEVSLDPANPKHDQFPYLEAVLFVGFLFSSCLRLSTQSLSSPSNILQPISFLAGSKASPNTFKMLCPIRVVRSSFQIRAQPFIQMLPILPETHR